MFEPLGEFVLTEQVVPVIPLDSFGFFASVSKAVDEVSPSGTNVTVSIVCPTNKIRRLLSAQVRSNGGAMNATTISIVHPEVSGAPNLERDAGGAATVLILRREILWYPGHTLKFTATFAAAQTFNARALFIEEEVGIAPTV